MRGGASVPVNLVPCRLRVWVVSTVCALALLPSLAHAQFGDTGIFSGNRRSYAPTPFELIDQTNGQVTLSFTDLVLPGGAGVPLQFGHTIDGVTGQWKLGLLGMVTEVADEIAGWSGGTCELSTTLSG